MGATAPGSEPDPRVHARRLSVLVVDRQPVMLAGVRAALESAGTSSVQTCADAETAVRLAQQSRPDVILLDCALPSSGVDVLTAVKRWSPSTVVVMFGTTPDAAEVLSCIRGGAAGYLAKDTSLHRLADVLLAACAGEPVIPRRVVAELLGGMPERLGDRADRWRRVAGLTERETHVLRLLHDGHSTAGIAKRLLVAPVTVRTHVASVMRKLDVRDREGLLRLLSEAPAAR